MSEPGYQIADDGKSITCERCGMTSYNLSDVRNRYCGYCHLFHQDNPERLVAGAVYIYWPDAPEPQIVNARMPPKPSLRDIEIVVLPVLDRHDGARREMEHVAVLFKDQPADMFVDETGVIDGLPRNEPATVIYRTAWLHQHPDDDPEELPHIAGPAVVFDPARRVWS